MWDLVAVLFVPVANNAIAVLAAVVSGCGSQTPFHNKVQCRLQVVVLTHAPLRQVCVVETLITLGLIKCQYS